MSPIELFFSALLAKSQPLLVALGVSGAVPAVQLATLFAVALVVIVFVGLAVYGTLKQISVSKEKAKKETLLKEKAKFKANFKTYLEKQKSEAHKEFLKIERRMEEAAEIEKKKNQADNKILKDKEEKDKQEKKKNKEKAEAIFVGNIQKIKEEIPSILAFDMLNLTQDELIKHGTLIRKKIYTLEALKQESEEYSICKDNIVKGLKVQEIEECLNSLQVKYEKVLVLEVEKIQEVLPSLSLLESKLLNLTRSQLIDYKDLLCKNISNITGLIDQDKNRPVEMQLLLKQYESKFQLKYNKLVLRLQKLQDFNEMYQATLPFESMFKAKSNQNELFVIQQEFTLWKDAMLALHEGDNMYLSFQKRVKKNQVEELANIPLTLKININNFSYQGLIFYFHHLESTMNILEVSDLPAAPEALDKLRLKYQETTFSLDEHRQARIKKNKAKPKPKP